MRPSVGQSAPKLDHPFQVTTSSRRPAGGAASGAHHIAHSSPTQRAMHPDGHAVTSSPTRARETAPRPPSEQRATGHALKRVAVLRSSVRPTVRARPSAQECAARMDYLAPTKQPRDAVGEISRARWSSDPLRPPGNTRHALETDGRTELLKVLDQIEPPWCAG